MARAAARTTGLVWAGDGESSQAGPILAAHLSRGDEKAPLPQGAKDTRVRKPTCACSEPAHVRHADGRQLRDTTYRLLPMVCVG